jgi:hypothetical protein
MHPGKNQREHDWTRRRFLQTAGSVAALAGTEMSGFAAVAYHGVSIVIDPTDSVASSQACLWAAGELERALVARSVPVLRCQRVAQANANDFCLVAASLDSPVTSTLLEHAKMTVARFSEALGVVHGKIEAREVTLACGYDSRAIVYALLDLTDRVQNAAQPVMALASTPEHTERPANEVRSITRLFVSEVQDKPWYNDREMWPHYLTMLATQRFNRFSLAFGIGYDFIRHVTDAYFLFTYPFLLNVPGYNVRVPLLNDAERDHNLEMLQFIGEQTVARGMEFHVGLWMHGYEWIDSPNANYTIEGLTKETHGAYCRDAVRMLLKSCPSISGVTFRIHGESGVQEGSYEFWKMVFEVGHAYQGHGPDHDRDRARHQAARKYVAEVLG